MPKTKKIFDILPPWEIKEGKRGSKKSAKKTKRRLRKKLQKRWLAAIPLLLFFAIYGFLYIFVETKAHVEIWPKTEPFVVKTQAVLTTTAIEIDFEQFIVPGVITQVDISLEKNFESAGTAVKAEKATGTIRVYNNFSTQDQPLMATTRFVSADGKLFRTPKWIVVPGGYYEKGELVPGSIDILVVAADPGEDYNIGPTSFSIPGFAGTNKYTAFYAKSFEAMSGGYKEEIHVIMAEDLNNAERSLAGMIPAEAKSALERKAVDGLLQLEESLKVEEIKFLPLVEIGQEAERFSAGMRAKAEIFAVSRDVLEEFSRVFLEQELRENMNNKELYKNSLNIDYYTLKIDRDKKELILDLTITAKVYDAIDEEELAESLKEKSLEDIERILRGRPDITRAEVKLYPFWARKSPEAAEFIEIDPLFD